MAAIEDILAWCNSERTRLSHQLEQLVSGHLRTYEKQAQANGWLEVDTTMESIERCRQYISELNAIGARYPDVTATPHVVAPPPPPPVAPPPAPPVQQVVTVDQRTAHDREEFKPDWISGWGVVKGTQPHWNCVGVYMTRTEAEAAAEQAGRGYYARWGTYNEGSKIFSSGPSFSPL